MPARRTECRQFSRRSAGAGGQGSPSPSEPPSASTPPGSEPSTEESLAGVPSPVGASSEQEEAGAGPREQQLGAASDRLAAAEGDEETSLAARDLQQQLRSLAADLDASRPGGKRPGETQPGGEPRGGQPGQATSPESHGSEDSLRPGGAQAIDRGLAQLAAAARRGEQGTLTAEASQALRRGGIADVVAGIDSQYGHNESGQAVVRQLNEQLAEPTSPVDLKTLQRLREQILSLQQDLTSQPPSPVEAGRTLHVDPASFPPGYRDSIQKYYQTLSEDR